MQSASHFGTPLAAARRSYAASGLSPSAASYGAPVSPSAEWHISQGVAILPPAAHDAGISRSVWSVACHVIFHELAAGRPCNIPGLGTFHSEQQRPRLMLAEHFEHNLGVVTPHHRAPLGPVDSTAIISWQALGDLCGLDSETARCGVEQAIAAFATSIAGMSSSAARSMSTLDLGPCGKLRIMRAGDLGAGGALEAIVSYTEELVVAVRRRGAQPSSAAAATFAGGIMRGGEGSRPPDRSSPDRTRAFTTLSGITHHVPTTRDYAICAAAASPEMSHVSPAPPINPVQLTSRAQLLNALHFINDAERDEKERLRNLLEEAKSPSHCYLGYTPAEASSWPAAGAASSPSTTSLFWPRLDSHSVHSSPTTRTRAWAPASEQYKTPSPRRVSF